ncbi:MAG: hypothetical protein D4R68_05630 [Ignavibacteriales bacterium]|nr:MAG: hypothetical protein D4R68_05630 [Ignavibacteriales bacterium]
MKYQFISFDQLQTKLEKTERVEQRIERLSFEIFQCNKWIIYLRSRLKRLSILQIELSTCDFDIDKEISTNWENDNSTKEDCTKYLVTILTEKLSGTYNEFLEQAQQLLDYYQTIVNIRLKNNDEGFRLSKTTSMNKKIIWKAGKDVLLKVFEALRKNEIFPDYKNSEILVHFCDEKHKCFCKTNGELTTLSWKDSDSTFAIFVDELAKRGAVNDNNKFKIFSEHFVNQQGDPFKDLAQKRNFTDNTTNTGGFIRNILKEISFSVLLLIIYPFISLYATLC